MPRARARERQQASPLPARLRGVTRVGGVANGQLNPSSLPIPWWMVLDWWWWWWSVDARPWWTPTPTPTPWRWMHGLYGVRHGRQGTVAVTRSGLRVVRTPAIGVLLLLLHAGSALLPLGWLWLAESGRHFASSS